MNFTLPNIPKRTRKIRETGITMIMDKGLSLRQVEDIIASSGDFIDLAKLGFGTAYVTKDLKKKIALYKEAKIKPYFGGTFFEAFFIRNKFDDYRKLLDKIGLELAEISDGSIAIEHDEKCECIRKLSEQMTVISEVGSKDASIIISPAKWITMMEKELSAGSWKVITEARESGTVGIYRENGKAQVSLINKILSKIPPERVIWEAPQKSQQVWFIKLLGANVNLGNIPPEEVIPLETLRLGLRGDTFFEFLPKELHRKQS